MDSKLLAGAYSKRYKYIEREHIENLKTDVDGDSNDALAKARRLSQETNKRRKLAAEKRKQDAAREEKRRQEILNKRHQEQKQATEKYQRCHVGHRPRFSPRRHGHSPTRSHVDLEDALRLVRGGSASSGPDQQSRAAIQRLYQQNGRDPLNKSHVRASHAGSGGQGDGSHNQKWPLSGRPQSGRPLDASMRAELMERSLRNLTSSRSRFEQQLEQHQQILMEQQQKSLHDFNQAIRREIDADTKVQGVEDMGEDNLPLRSQSLSSLDSLEEESATPLGNSLQSHQILQEFHQAAEQQKTEGQGQFDRGNNSVTELTKNSGSVQERPTRPQSAKVPPVQGQHEAQRYTNGLTLADVATGNGSAGSHIIGPIPQGYYTPPAGAPPSSTPVIHGNLSYYPDSLDANQSSPERRVTVGTALRLPQQPTVASQPVKQPPPALQYDSQLLAHRKFETRPNHPGTGADSRHNGDSSDVMVKNNPQRNGLPDSQPTVEHQTSALTQNQLPRERPKAHVYAWTSPPPVEDEQDPSGVPVGERQASAGNANYSASIVADRVMATHLHPQTSRNISTAATTTWVYQTVNGVHNKEPAFSQANTNSNSLAPAHQTSFGAQTAHAEIPKGQGQKPGTVLTSSGTYPATTGLKFVATMPANFQGHSQAFDNRQQGHLPTDHQGQGQSGSGREGSAHQHQQGGSIRQGTLGLVNGRLTIMNSDQAENKKITVVESDTDGRKEVRGILKRANKDSTSSKGSAGGQPKFNVQDSVEIAKKHLSAEAKRKKAKKKGVRFADLHYADDDLQEDSDSADSMTDACTTAANNDASPTKVAGKTAAGQRPRPASARVVSTTPKSTENKAKGPRTASAGPTRHPPASRPKAAAHIIMSGEGAGHHGNESSAAGITVHKSQLDKKVMLINNNFMSRVPVSTNVASTTTAAAAPVSNTSAAVYAASAATTGTVGGAGGYNKTVASGQAGDQTRGAGGKSTVPTLHTTTVLPSHSHFSNANNTYKGVYNENGMRIDRTPTDDEINNLWKNMRTMLDVSDGKGGSQTTTSTSNGNNEPGTRPQVQVSHQYIDGAALGIPNGMSRVIPGYTNPKSVSSSVSGTQAGQAKTGGPAKNGYLQRYSLLQQRRNPTSGIGASSRTNGVVEQTVQTMPLSSNGADPRYGQVNVSYAPREEMSESMAGFLAAEQAVQTQGTDVRDSRVLAAMESAQNQQEMYNSIRQKVAKGGPSALSMEEHRLLESLDKLNERLKVVENRPNNPQQAVNYSSNPTGHQVYVHGSGFRGHQILTSQSQRRSSAGLRPMGRPVSARLLTRPYH